MPFSKKKKNPVWIEKTHLFKADEYICSACGCKSEKPYRFCSGCGAQMAKVKYDASWVDEMEFFDMMDD